MRAGRTPVADHVLSRHEAQENPHSQYLRAEDLDGISSGPIATHLAETDPHPQYIKPATVGDYAEPIGSAQARVNDHNSAFDHNKLHSHGNTQALNGVGDDGAARLTYFSEPYAKLSEIPGLVIDGGSWGDTVETIGRTFDGGAW